MASIFRCCLATFNDPFDAVAGKGSVGVKEEMEADRNCYKVLGKKEEVGRREGEFVVVTGQLLAGAHG